MNFASYRGSPSALALLMTCGVVATVVPSTAEAACAPAAANGATVTCTGTALPAFASNLFSGVTVNVVTGASITGNQNTGGTTPNFQFSSVTIGDTSTLNNAGLIQNNSNQRRDNVAVNLAGTGTTLNNTGTITANVLPASNSANNNRLYGVIASARTASPTTTSR